MTCAARISRPALLAALLCAQAPALVAQATTLSEGSPEEVGMSSAILSAGFSLFEDAVRAGDLVGAVVLVAKDGKVVLHEATGMRDMARGLPMERSTMFRMASNTKPVVATALATLVEDDRIAFADPVRRYIPSFDNYRSGYITVGHLLSHTSGLRIGTLFLQPYMEPSADHPDAPTLQLEAARFGAVGAEVPPGSSYSYNNPGFNTLGALIEITSGRMLDEYIRSSVYEPLGMVDSYHHEVDEKMDGKLDRMGVVYYQRREGEWQPGWTPGDPPQVPFVRASGGMISTAWDYAIFLQMYLNGGSYGDTRVLEPGTVRMLTGPKTDRIGGPDSNPSYYGYGWQVSESGAFGHSGSDGTYAWADPGSGIIGIVLTQTPNGENPVDRFRELVRLSVDPG